MSRLIPLLFAFYIFGAYALEWPVNHAVVTATFGESRWNHFHSGIDIGGGAQEIHAVDKGEVIFYYEENSRPDDIPTGMGNFLVVEHENGLRSLYAHLKKDSILSGSRHVNPEDVLGLTGDTGGSLGVHLHLELIDETVKQIINPLLYLPAVEDSLKPVIQEVILTRGGETLDLRTVQGFKPGPATLIAEIYDLINSGGYAYKVAPFYIVVEVNGTEVINIRYEGLKEKEGREILVKSPDLDFQSYYLSGADSDWKVRLGEIDFYPGKTYLRLIVGDFKGNSTSKTYILDVKS